jgi:hypothetical protein
MVTAGPAAGGGTTGGFGFVTGGAGGGMSTSWGLTGFASLIVNVRARLVPRLPRESRWRAIAV